MRIGFYDTNNPNHLKILAVASVCLMLGLAVGYSWGWANCTEWIAGVAVKYLDFEGMDTEELAKALTKYRDHIDSGT